MHGNRRRTREFEFMAVIDVHETIRRDQYYKFCPRYEFRAEGIGYTTRTEFLEVLIPARMSLLTF